MCSKNIGISEKIYRTIKDKNMIYAEEIAQYCDKVYRQLKPNLIILHGSTAKGRHGKWSDIDLIIIANFDTPFIDRIGELIELNETRAPIEPLGYTPKEFDEMLLKLNPLTLEAVENGIPLIGQKLFKQLKNTLEEMKNKGLKKTRVTWTTLKP